MWSCGVILFFLLRGWLSFSDKDFIDVKAIGQLGMDISLCYYRKSLLTDGDALI